MSSPRRPCDASRRSERPAAVNTLSLLPLEVQTQIIELACASPHLTSIDSKTTAAVMSLSQHFYALAAPLLYRNVKVTRPSMLVELVRALEAKPELGRLIRNLHLGSDAQVNDPMWPMLAGGQTGEVIWTSLRDEQLLPQWCCPRRGWNVDRPEGVVDHRDKAVLDALEAAQLYLGVDLWYPKHDVHDKYIGSLPWLVGVIEVQAALDLYLMEIRRLEDKAGHTVRHHDGVPFAILGPPHFGPRLEYPALCITNASTCPEDLPGVFSLSYETVVEHLARRGALTDRFDHPLIMARAGMQVLDFDEDGEAGPSPRVYLQNDPEELSEDVEDDDEDELNQEEDEMTQEEYERALRPRCAAARYARSTKGESLAFARRLLELATRVQNLFLSGLFQQLISDASAGQQLPTTIRGLHVGPLSFCHADSLGLSHDLGLNSLERLHIRGAHLAVQKRKAVTAHSSSLREVLWDFSDCLDSAEDVFAAIKPFFNLDLLASTSRKSSASRLKAVCRSGSARSGGAQDTDSRARISASSPTITLRIKSSDEELMKAHLNDAGRTAWREGCSLSSPSCRLQLRIQSVELNLPDLRMRNEAKTGVSNAYEHLNEQWQRCVAGSGSDW